MIKTKNITIKQVEQENLEAILNLLSDQEVADSLGLPLSKITKNNISSFIVQTDLGTTCLPMCAYSNDTGELIGSIIFANIHPVKRSAYIKMLVISEKFRGSGYGVELGNSAIKTAFNEFNLNRIYASTYSHNKSMDGIYRLGGFKQEGVQRMENFISGKWVDKILWGVLKKEYNYDVKELEV